MRCGRVRHLLWSGTGPRPVNPEIQEAWDHLVTCNACQRFFEEMQGTADTLHRLAPAPRAPAAVRERLFALIARQRAGESPPPRRWGKIGLIALACVLASGIGVAAWRLQTGFYEQAWQVPITTFAEDHLQVHNRHSLQTSDPEALREWLAQHAPFPVRPLEIAGATLQGGRLCLLNGSRGVVIEYRLEGRPISYYIMPTQGETGDKAIALRHGARAGYNVVGWQHAGLYHALVGGVPQHRLREMAHRCIDQEVETG